MQSPLNDIEQPAPFDGNFLGGCPGSIGACGGPASSEVGVNPKDLIGMTKPPLSLVPPCFEIYVAMAMKNGAQKYGPYNWRKEKILSMEYLNAAKRHIAAFIDGETNAKDSGQHHLAHAAACMAILLDAFLNDCIKDNRPVPGKTAELIERFTEKKEKKSNIRAFKWKKDNYFAVFFDGSVTGHSFSSEWLTMDYWSLAELTTGADSLFHEIDPAELPPEARVKP